METIQNKNRFCDAIAAIFWIAVLVVWLASWPNNPKAKGFVASDNKLYTMINTALWSKSIESFINEYKQYIEKTILNNPK